MVEVELINWNKLSNFLIKEVELKFELLKPFSLGICTIRSDW